MVRGFLVVGLHNVKLLVRHHITHVRDVVCKILFDDIASVTTSMIKSSIP